MVDYGIKPMYVFDGKPPELKGGVVSILSHCVSSDLSSLTCTDPIIQLAKRFAARNAAADASEEAKETGTVEEIDKLARRQVRPTKQHNEECRRLLELMGIPILIVSGL